MRWAAAPVGPLAQRRFDRTMVFSAAMLVLTPILFLPSVYEATADDVKDGKALRPAGITWRIFENPLGLRVERVHVSWIDDMKARYDFGSSEVMYLGRANGVAVFFDPRNQRTVRVPDGGIVIEREN